MKKTLPKTILPRMTSLGKRRMRKLIAFLRHLPRRKFDFDRVVASHNEKRTCATVGCVIGWMPKAFPMHFHWEPETVAPRFRKGSSFSGYVDVNKFLELPEQTTYAILTPGGQKDIHPDLPKCDITATPKQVAAMLEAYIALTETPAP